MCSETALFTGLLSGLFGRSFSDIFSGYRVFSRRFVKSFPVLSSGFEIETEMSVHALELQDAGRRDRDPLSGAARRVARPSCRPSATAGGSSRRSARSTGSSGRCCSSGSIGALLLVIAAGPAVDPAGDDLPRHRPGAALPDRDPGHRHDHHRRAVLLRRPDPRHRHPRPARDAAAGLSVAAGAIRASCCQAA